MAALVLFALMTKGATLGFMSVLATMPPVQL